MQPNTPASSKSRRRGAAALAPALFVLTACLVGVPVRGQSSENSGNGPTPEPATSAQESSKEVEAETAPAPALPSSSGGLRVFVDPETGEILERPRPEQIRALRALELERRASPATAPPPDPVRVFAVDIPGGVGADLPEDTLSSTVLRILPDGTFETLCVDHSDEAGHVHAEPTEPPPATTDREEVR